MLVTAAAAPSMAIVQHRQPLCLEDDEVNASLDAATPRADIKAILAAEREWKRIMGGDSRRSCRDLRQASPRDQ